MKRALVDGELRNKILFIFGILVVYRVLANVPLPGVDVLALRAQMAGSDIASLLNLFSGGGFSNVSIVLLGVAPYITASIIMQLMQTIVPSLERINKEEGEAGRRKFTMWTRFLAVPLAALQAYGMLSLLKSQQVVETFTPFTWVVVILTATAGSILLMWLGELITEKGLGNGVSIMIFAGIVAAMPTYVSNLYQTYDSTQFFSYLVFLALALATTALVILVNEGQRLVPVSYARKIRGVTGDSAAASHLPLKINQAGVIPIIFALSLLVIPQLVAGLMSQSASPELQVIAQNIILWANKVWVTGLATFILVALFTYFYTSVVFDPFKIAENLQKQGGFIPGIRPGTATAEYLGQLINRITLFGAIFLATIAILPNIIQGFTGLTALAIGGTSLLIVVSVVLEFMKHIEGQVSLRSYHGL